MSILPAQFALAPMAEVSTPILRKLIKKFSKNVLLFTEMISAKGYLSGGQQNIPLATTFDFDPPFVYQLVGNSPEHMAIACEQLSEKKPFSIDINMGCPMHDIIKKGHGARLMTDFENTRKIIQQCRKKTSCCLSAKIRSGYDNDNSDYLLTFAKMLQDEGVDFITLHPRYARLVFTRTAKWKLVSLLKEHLSIPVIGNGDIRSAEDAVQKIHTFHCDGAMIGRQAAETPWIFNQCNSITGNESPIKEVNLHKMFIETLDDIEIFLPEQLHKSRAHRFCFYFSKNLLFAHSLFKQIRKHDKIVEMKKVVDNYFDNNTNEIIKPIQVNQ